MLFFLSCVPGLLGAVSPESPADSDKSPVPATALRALADRADRELRGDILPFWLEHARDREHEGFYGYLGPEAAVKADSPRGSLLTSRILWTFSAAYRQYRDPHYLEMARWAYRDLVEHFLDKENGGLYWTVTADGRPLDTRKQTYGIVFGIYGLAEYYRATGDAAALEQAKAIYRVVEQHARDPKNGGYFEAFSRTWVRLDDSAPFLVGPNIGKSQNTHIHILEAYTNLLRAWPDPGLRQSQRELLELVLTRIINPSTHHLVLFMRDDWTPVSKEVSYGHDIELSWLIDEAAEAVGDPALVSRTRSISLEMAETILRQGVESDGGIFNEGDADGRVTDAAKEWWPQAEAVTGFLNAYQISRDPRFFAASLRTWNFIQDKFIDRKYGDWYSSLDSHNVPIPRPKLTIWKCPYHNSRCCLEVIGRLGELSGSQQ